MQPSGMAKSNVRAPVDLRVTARPIRQNGARLPGQRQLAKNCGNCRAMQPNDTSIELGQVGVTGIEPALPKKLDPKSSASASSATPPKCHYIKDLRRQVAAALVHQPNGMAMIASDLASPDIIDQ